MDIPGLRVRIEKALGRKCERCWNYSEQVGKDSRYPTVCERCSEALGRLKVRVVKAVAVVRRVLESA